MSYQVFTRNWWKHNPAWPRGLEPDSDGARHNIDRVSTEQEAREICEDWNAAHDPGKLSRKAEYTEI